MSIHIIALSILVVSLCIYAWKDWFKGLCGLIIMTAVVMHPSFPQNIAGVQGLNPWNLVFANVFLAWLRNRGREGLFWDIPKVINVFLVLWLGVLMVSTLRMLVDRSTMTDYPLVGLVSDYIINTIKWPIAGLMLFDGCRTRHRAEIALACICLLFALFMVQIAMTVSSRVALEGNVELEDRAVLNDETGISPNSAGKMTSGLPWAFLTLIPLLKRRMHKLAIVGVCVASMYIVALSGSRSGFGACFATLVFLCLVRWRRYLPLLPLAVLILPVAFPGAADRALEGFGETTVTGEKVNKKSAIFSGRIQFWAAVIPKILDSPVWGHGRKAMRRTGLEQSLANEFGERSGMVVSHPHNAYLEVLLESGLIGFVVVVGLYMSIWVYSIRLFVDREDSLRSAVGGFTLALLTGHLVAFMGGQSFDPRETDVGLWCAIGLMLRFYVDRESSRHQSELDIYRQHMYYQGHYDLATPVD